MEDEARSPEDADAPDRTLSRALPMQLLRAREAVMRRFRPLLRKLGLTDQQGRIIRTLAEADWIDMIELSSRCCMHPASLSRTVPLLEERGLVRRRQDQDDGRRVAVSLTRKGRTTFATISREFDKTYADLAAELGQSRIEELHRSLDALIDTLGGPAATVPSETEVEG